MDDILVEYCVLEFINQSQDKNAYILGLTARSFSTAQRTHDTLLKNNLDFSQLSGLGNICIEDKNKEGLNRGIIFTKNRQIKLIKLNL